MKIKTQLQCYILSDHCVPASSSTRFFKVIHLIICFQTQITHRKWVITFLKNIQINKNVFKINYGSNYNIVQINTIHVTSPLYHLKFIFQSPITLRMNHTLGSRCNNTHQFHNKQLTSVMHNYTKTQTYMKWGTMSVKTHPGALRST